MYDTLKSNKEDISNGNHYSTMNAKNEENMYDFPKNSKEKYDINIFINALILRKNRGS